MDKKSRSVLCIWKRNVQRHTVWLLSPLPDILGEGETHFQLKKAELSQPFHKGFCNAGKTLIRAQVQQPVASASLGSERAPLKKPLVLHNNPDTVPVWHPGGPSAASPPHGSLHNGRPGQLPDLAGFSLQRFPAIRNRPHLRGPLDGGWGTFGGLPGAARLGCWRSGCFAG